MNTNLTENCYNLFPTPFSLRGTGEHGSNNVESIIPIRIKLINLRKQTTNTNNKLEYSLTESLLKRTIIHSKEIDVNKNTNKFLNKLFPAPIEKVVTVEGLPLLFKDTNNPTNINKGPMSHMSYMMNNLNIINLNNNMGIKHGILLSYNKTISYNYNKSNSIFSHNTESSTKVNYFNKIDISNINKLLQYYFKSIYCLISKPVYIHTPDKVIIQIFYFLTIPKKIIFRLLKYFYIKNFKSRFISFLYSKNLKYKKWNRNPKIKWKTRRNISKLRRKTTRIRNILFKLRKFTLIKVYKTKFNILCKLLSNKFNKSVELQLIRLHHTNHDSNILVNLLSLNIKNKTKKARVAIQKIYSKRSVKIIKDPNLISVNEIPNFISGLNIKIAGRLMGEPIIPRLTNKILIKGASSPGKVNYLDIATITKKNRKGAYTISIKSGQNFFSN